MLGTIILMSGRATKKSVSIQIRSTNHLLFTDEHLRPVVPSLDISHANVVKVST